VLIFFGSKVYFFVLICNSRQLGNKGNSKLVSLVQGLSHQVHLFLVEYNKVNHLQLNLPGFKPRTVNINNNANKSNSESNVPEEILHQQRLLLQSCDRYVELLVLNFNTRWQLSNILLILCFFQPR